MAIKTREEHATLALRLRTKHGINTKLQWDQDAQEATLLCESKAQADELYEVFGIEQGYQFAFEVKPEGITKETTIEQLCAELNGEQLDHFIQFVTNLKKESESVKQVKQLNEVIDDLPQFGTASSYSHLMA